MLFQRGLLALAVSVVFVASAQARPSTKSYTCAGVKQLVARNGAIVMNTKNRHVYNRFVANRSYCQLEEITRSVSVPTKSGRCRLKICIEYDPYDN